jgi:hyperosmotically inducible periplasmic protein
MVSNRWLRACFLIAALCAGTCLPVTRAWGQDKEPRLSSPANRDQRRTVTLADEVRHQLVTLPYYSVFDWLEASVSGNGEVTLTGDVVRPTTKSDAEARIKDLESVNNVVNKINVLPLSPSDDQLRIALYRAIFRFDSPLFRYGTAAVPSIHITVANGHVRLRGAVASKEDAQLAYMAANGVSGVFEVKNELRVEGERQSQ